ncbi:hypothetical protein CBR_g23145 [Chara braunii]|uniref:Reverse transcriptase zinc-binding domain-containing protein n=1 Tax=Chara braunii TaxID=69332 RepID=A0A388L3P9_CHABU|nr:hypothetical protein CBR_g23145 [Chara braunii]|eukprot:GBG76931.1 hypothetical protein CBR_g23145 [Chara braunii]
MLGKWITRVATMEDEREWVVLAGYILKNDWGLTREEDVWICVHMDSYLRRGSSSQVWSGILRAWRKLKPEQVIVDSKTTVLRQNLFDNVRIRDLAGDPLQATNAKGCYGRKWIERGVVTIGDIWDKDKNQWKEETQLREKLGRLRMVGPRLGDLVEAIPDEWKAMLQQGGVKEGTWYRITQEEGQINRFGRVISEEEDMVIVEEWTRREEGESLISYEQTTARSVEDLREQVRVELPPKWKRGKPTLLLCGGRGVEEMRMDPQGRKWRRNPQSREAPTQASYAPKFGVSHLRKPLDAENRTWQKLKISLDLPEGAQESHLRELWDQLQLLPARKQAGLLWMLSRGIVPATNWLWERGMEVETLCQQCGGEMETARHIFVECTVAQQLWEWWRTQWQKWTNGVLPWDETWILTGRLPASLISGKGWGYLAQVARAILLWVLWQGRNARVFREEEVSLQHRQFQVRSQLRTAVMVDWARKVMLLALATLPNRAWRAL